MCLKMEDIQIPWLTATIVLPLIASMAIPVIPDKNGKTVRLYTLSVGLINLALIVYGFWSNYSLDNTELQLQETYS